MKYGRIIRVTSSPSGSYTTYVVAEEDSTKAMAMISSLVGPTQHAETVGRASLKLLLVLGLSAGEFKETDC
jgi:hypothetical protein